MILETYCGSIEFKDNTVFLRSSKKDPGKQISFNQIQTVTLVKPTFGCNAGCLYVQVVGGPIYMQFKNATSYVGNPYAILFRKNQLDEVIQFKEAMDAALADKPCSNQSADSTNAIELLSALKLLYSEGILSDEEFLLKKSMILDM